jgi:hypothetical protein
MMLRFPRLALAVITLGVITTFAGISVHAGAEIGSLLPASPMFEARSGKVLSVELAQTSPSAAPETCKVTLPSTPTDNPPLPMPGDSGFQRSGRFGTDRLWTVLPMNGIWRGLTPKAFGEYAYSNKLPWGGAFSYKDKNGPLMVTGRRLDGPAPSFTETEPISGVHGMMGGINIPVFGCWEITGRYNDEELSFTVWVAPWVVPLTEPTDPETSQEPVEASPPPRRIQVDAETEATQLVYQVNPELPHEAQVADISGTVVLEAVVGIDGRPRNLRYLSGPPLLAQAAIDAVTWWQYRVDGENTETLTTIPVVFPSTPRPS